MEARTWREENLWCVLDSKKKKQMVFQTFFFSCMTYKLRSAESSRVVHSAVQKYMAETTDKRPLGRRKEIERLGALEWDVGQLHVYLHKCGNGQQRWKYCLIKCHKIKTEKECINPRCSKKWQGLQSHLNEMSKHKNTPGVGMASSTSWILPCSNSSWIPQQPSRWPDYSELYA